MSSENMFTNAFNNKDESQSTNTLRGSGKRKRGAGETGSTPRKQRATPAQVLAQAGNHTTAGAPTANMNNQNNFINPGMGNANEDTTPEFDLGGSLQHQAGDASSLQQNTSVQVSNSDQQSINTAVAALNNYTMTVPPHPAEGFANEPTAGQETGVNQFIADGHQFQSIDGNTSGGEGGMTPGKPQVGSAEWHKVRKENHKEVERRRRETINEGINEISKIVPGNEKNKGAILARAVQYIQKLHEESTSNIEKWTFEKLITEQAIADLSSKLQRAWAEKEAWKRVARENGVDIDNVDLGLQDYGIDSKSQLDSDNTRSGQMLNNMMSAQRRILQDVGKSGAEHVLARAPPGQQAESLEQDDQGDNDS